jgi:hypothetical protein
MNVTLTWSRIARSCLAVKAVEMNLMFIAIWARVCYTRSR